MSGELGEPGWDAGRAPREAGRGNNCLSAFVWPLIYPAEVNLIMVNGILALRRSEWWSSR